MREPEILDIIAGRNEGLALASRHNLGGSMKLMISTALGVAGVLFASAAFAGVKVPEGTEFQIRVEEALSSSTAHEGDRFTVSLDDDVKLSDGTVLRAGYRGLGEVVEARDNGILGKNGKLNVRLLYLKVGDDRIKLRANKGAKGETRVGATVATVILFWPAAPFIKGKDVSIKKGTIMTAYADQDVDIASPVPPPPEGAN
ncbi:hypothetical protein [uncultured Caulobacter sp.]|uniref:hypothetical protein n=1 Tax=uncultured Caulobacter sp. TaxID=158749 RepID=UPI00263480EE|nr:hypothetical protein [uncultured Caulobacter sp.]